MALSSKIALAIAATLSSPLDVSGRESKTNLTPSWVLGNGTGANQANAIFTDTRTLAASANEDLDLAGALTDAFGATLTFTNIKAIFVLPAAANTNNVNVTRPASNGAPLFLAAGDGLGVQPGGMFSLMAPGLAGVTVTAGTGDLLNIANSAGGSAVTYTIIIIGVV